MSLIDCPECSKKVSDSANACIHCGYPLEKKSLPVDQQGWDEANSIKEHAPEREETNGASLSIEGVLSWGVDAVFGLFYLWMIYLFFFTDEMSKDFQEIGLGEGAEWFSIFMAFLVVYIVQKVVRAVLSTIGRAVDKIFNS